MFSQRADKEELMDNLSLQDEALRQNLDEFISLNRWFGSKNTLINALDKIYKKYKLNLMTKKIVIADLGTGAGDLLLAMNEWARAKQLQVEIIGLDANPFMIEYAKQKSTAYSNINYKIIDILSDEFSQLHFDIVCANNFCHHFNDQTLVALFKKLYQQTQFAIVVNDLHRHWLSYFFIKFLSKLCHFSNLAKHDGPLSVLRAFRKKELQELLKKATINTYGIRWSFAFRWQLIIWCKNSV